MIKVLILKISNFICRRVDKPPSKDLVRLYIRSYAIRLGQNPTSPWVVDEAQVKKNGLPGKFADFMMTSFILTPPSEVSDRDLPKNVFNNGANLDQNPMTFRKIYFPNIDKLVTVFNIQLPMF